MTRYNVGPLRLLPQRMHERIAPGLALPDRLNSGLPHRLEGRKAVEAAPSSLASPRGGEPQGGRVPSCDPDRKGRGVGTTHERETFELEASSGGRFSL